MRDEGMLCRRDEEGGGGRGRGESMGGGGGMMGEVLRKREETKRDKIDVRE